MNSISSFRNLKALVFAAALFSGLAFWGAAASAGGRSWRWTFDEGEAGSALPGFRSQSGSWALRREPTTSGKTNGFFAPTEEAGRSSGDRIALFEQGGNLRDLVLQVRLRLPRASGFAGVLLKRRDAEACAVVLSASDQEVRLVRMGPAGTVVLAKAKAKVPAGAWQRLQVFCKDDRLSCLIDGQKVFQAKDPALLESGLFGLIAGGGPADFDNLSLVDIGR